MTRSDPCSGLPTATRRRPSHVFSTFHRIGTGGIGTETLDLPGRVGDIPSVLISHDPSTSLEIVTGVVLAVLDSEGELELLRWGGL